MTAYGLTKARSLGPVVEAVERAGGSVSRVFRRAELPLRIVERPDCLILLRDQVRLLEAAAREIGDASLPARLSSEAGIEALGAYAARVMAEPTLGAAILCANETVGALLQSATPQRLEISGATARWTYEWLEPGATGREMNELLALGYRLDLMRRFLGPRWTPQAVTLTGGAAADRAVREAALGCEIRGGRVMSVIFPAEILDARNCALQTGGAGADPTAPVPDGDRLIDLAEALIALDLLDRMPRLDDLSRRLGLSRRDLQRRLERLGANFSVLRGHVLQAEAERLLRDTARPVTAVALELGYSDPAHFTRAFRAWMGQGPRRWRAMARFPSTDQ